MKYHYSQKGSALIFALLILFLTTIISPPLLRNSALDLQMASNQQFKLEALQKTEAISDALFDLFVSGNVDGYLLEEGDRLCASGDGHNKCLSSATITLPSAVSSLVSADGVTPEFYAEHKAAKVPAHTIMKAGKAGSENFDLYEIHVTYDATDKKQGKSEIAQGVVVSYVDGSVQERRESDGSMLREMGAAAPTP